MGYFKSLSISQISAGHPGDLSVRGIKTVFGPFGGDLHLNPFVPSR